ncbi:hypothetical protein V866_003442 [Kwoniella sp. B9012]
MADIAACIAYLRSSTFLGETNNSVDQNKIIVSGGSAGGWLALFLGSGIGFEVCSLTPPEPPLAVVPLYPITDICAPFFNTKQSPVSYFGRMIEHSEVTEYMNPSAPATSESALESTRSKCYPYMVQEAIEAKLLLEGTGIPPEAFSIASAIASGEAKLPPMFIVHGT